MKITSVNVRKIEKEGSRMKGIASVLLDDSFAVHDIRIIEGDNGLFIAMPSRKTATGGYRDIAHPINPEVRAMFEDAILEAYKNAPDEEENEESEEEESEEE
ncbi:MAG: septation regulator SpoVG [Bacilli bacterium]|nr:septation regulator SpoVG [Bacilli bacterium]